MIELAHFNGKVAIIKRCRNQNDPRTTPRFRNEVDALKLVASHEHITQLWDADISRLTLTLRAEPGQSLDKYVDSHRNSILLPGDSTTLWKQISSALAHLHANSITHDDVKPDNIMWDQAAQHSVLIDFGAALNHKVLPENWFNPSGTPPYAPPEFLQRRKGSAADVWALGVTMLFAFKYVKLPDGDWILPHAFENALVLEEMRGWLTEVEGWRQVLAEGAHSLLADMLEQDPNKRILAAELELQLKARGTQ
ncbi:hypothetical protein SLS64_006397 [Diaporthe eres]|uniref:Protein kinase domain-containing protein n=1 Tax=Diaporthe eres TaxID=83184 RepID=A0ABR1P9B8_DIAER